MKGKLIVIEGLDGSGKATQSQKLYSRLCSEQKNATQISFPNYESNSSALVKMYLNGEFGTNPDSVNPYAASSFYAVDRFASYKTVWKDNYENGGIIIADRYTTSNAIHQCSKLPREKWDKFLKWLFDFEYKLLEIPEPDAVIYLRVDPSVSQELMNKRYSNNAAAKDIHERNLDYLIHSRETADYCARILNWDCIDCIRNGKMRSIDDIFNELLNKVTSVIY